MAIIHSFIFSTISETLYSLQGMEEVNYQNLFVLFIQSILPVLILLFIQPMLYRTEESVLWLSSPFQARKQEKEHAYCGSWRVLIFSFACPAEKWGKYGQNLSFLPSLLTLLCSEYNSWNLVPSDNLIPTVAGNQKLYSLHLQSTWWHIINNILGISHIITWYWIPSLTCFDENIEILT